MATEVGAPLEGAASEGLVSPCEEGGELTPPLVIVRPGERFEVQLSVCGAPAIAVVHFGGQRLLQQRVAGPIAVPVAAPNAPGDTLLIFGVAPISLPWKAKGEVVVGRAILFRHKKSSQSSEPNPRWAVMIRVIP